MQLRGEQLETDLARGLRPLYVIHGDEPLLALEAADAVRAAARAGGYTERDVLLVERNPVAQDEDEVDLYVANGWRASVLKYGLEVVRDTLNDRPIDVRVVDPVVRNPASQPAASPLPTCADAVCVHSSAIVLIAASGVLTRTRFIASPRTSVQGVVRSRMHRAYRRCRPAVSAPTAASTSAAP